MAVLENWSVTIVFATEDGPKKRMPTVQTFEKMTLSRVMAAIGMLHDDDEIVYGIAIELTNPEIYDDTSEEQSGPQSG